MRKEKSFKEANISLVKKAFKYAVIIGIIAGVLIMLMEAVGCTNKANDEITYFSCTIQEEITYGTMVSIIVIPTMMAAIIIMTYIGWFLEKINKKADS